MPAVPKKRVSKARKRARRSMWKLSAPNKNQCPQCHSPKLSHHMCPKCGYYDGRKVVDMEAAAAK